MSEISLSPRAALSSVIHLAGRFSLPSAAPSPVETWRRVLWVRLDHLGDVTMSLPMLAALRRAVPQAEIDCVVRPSVAPLLRASGLRLRILTYDSPRFPEKRHWWGRGDGFYRTIALGRRLRARHYDAAFELRGDEIGRLLVYGSGAPLRIGPDRQFYEQPGAPNGAFLLTRAARLPVEPRHAVENNLALLSEVGIGVETEVFRFPVSETSRQTTELKLEAMGVGGRFVGLHLCSNDGARNWDAAKWAQLADWLPGATGLRVVFTGIWRDRDEIRCVRALMAHPERAIEAAGRFDLGELPALFEKMALFVTVDTGPMHLAACQDTPTIALMRPDLAPRHYPWRQAENVVAGDPVASIEVERVRRQITILNR